MTVLTQSVYPLDLTMTLPSNYIQNEKKVFDDVQDRIFVPDGGPFFSQSLKITNSNGTILKPKVDYKLLHLNEEATLESGRDVVAVIQILKSTIKSISLDYRVVGGPYSNTVSAILQFLQDGGGLNGKVDWNTNVYNKPDTYPTAPHFHTPDTFTDWAMVYEQLEGIRKAIITGDDPSWESHYNYIDRKLNVVKGEVMGGLANYVTVEQLNKVVGGIDVSVDLSGYYTKIQIDNSLNTVNTSISNTANNLRDNYYTKTQADGKYALKTDGYTKTQSDGRYALKTDYYTSVVSDGRYALKTDLSKYATTDRVNQLETSLTQKINSAVIQAGNIDLSSYYKKTETYSKQETYTQAQVNNLINAAKTEVTNSMRQEITQAVNGFVPVYSIVNLAHAANHSTADAHWNGKSIIRVNATAKLVSTVNISGVGDHIPVGRTLTIRNVGAGEVKLVANAGVKLVPNEAQTLRRSGSTATLIYVGGNTIDVITELE